jgi:hypothetical protein
MSLTSTLFRLARLSADARAVRRGRVGQRVVNKALGRGAGRFLNKLWR